jgi:XPG N-terminal domain
MGVKGLWRLLLPIGRRIALESLEGKILAIDASIWLTQFIKAMRDKETGNALPHAHLTGFFKRICRLKYHGIRPIFVFDGATPEIKKRETALRRRRREAFASTLHNEAAVQRLAKRILAQHLQKENLMKTKKAPPLAGAVAPAHAGAGSYADCFNPGEQEAPSVAAVATVATTSDTTAASPSTTTVAAAVGVAAEPRESNDVSKEDEAAIMAAIQDMVEEEEAKKSKAAIEQTNDWECPMEDEEQNEGGGSEQQNDDDDAQHVTLYDDCNGSDNDDSLNVAYIASLPPDKRKDAIEKAKRQQRTYNIYSGMIANRA